jgi:hypothetical protein
LSQLCPASFGTPGASRTKLELEVDGSFARSPWSEH